MNLFTLAKLNSPMCRIHFWVFEPPCGRLGAGDDPEVAGAFRGALKLMPEESAAGVAAGILKRQHLGQRIDNILNKKA